ncbi:MAG: YhjD/YihY/BrkB family envelope integrity protein [Phycisphaeraceae bacterium]
MRKLLNHITQFLRRVVNSPVGELNRAQRFLRYCIDLVLHCSRALRHDRAGEMAAALTYRTIFSLVPLLVMVLLVFQAFGGLDQVRKELQPLAYRMMGIDTVRLPTDAQIIIDAQDAAKEKAKNPDTGTLLDDPPAPPPGPGEGPIDKAKQAELDAQKMIGADTMLTKVTESVSRIDFKSVGAVGFVLFLWAAIELAVTIELSFNRVFNSPQGRPWLRRIPIYWAVITLGPVLVWASLSVAGQLVSAAEGIPVLSAIVGWSSSLFALAASWLLLFLLYKLMPNTTVNVGTALAGSFAAAVLWETGKFGFSLYVSKFLPYAKLYGVLGLLPLFLFWIYITWWIVLFGLELTYTLQAMGGRQFKYALPVPQQQQHLDGDPQWIIPIMTQIGHAFGEGKALDSYKLADRLNLPDRLVVSLCLKLEKAELIHRVVQGDDHAACYSLARPPEQIDLARLLAISESIREGSGPARQQAGWQFLRRMTQVQRDAVNGQTLAGLLAEPAVKAESDSEVNSSESTPADSPSRQGGAVS